ncbi:MAG: hypothetical protein OEY22_03690 [Candidatus Bathyarchaeota archaeon]|nr:hypothetical protein [Candidatus Bathyarchaeota archaeon]MDH5786869.1 hypothetical protein [Candidatus Bathyarchaeota archaeon]
MKLREIEDTFHNLSMCPRCNSNEGFWLGLRSGHVYVQCKGCGAKLEFFKIFPMDEKVKPLRRWNFF